MKIQEKIQKTFKDLKIFKEKPRNRLKNDGQKLPRDRTQMGMVDEHLKTDGNRLLREKFQQSFKK